MAINLSKGERVSLDNSLYNLTIGLGWDPNEGTGDDFDLDASAFMLGSNGKIPNDDYFVFYNSENRVHPDNLNKLEYYNKIKYPKNFIIMDVEDQKTVLRQVFNELGLTSKVFTFKQVLRYISKQKYTYLFSKK